MEVLHWIGGHWLDLVQTAGIMAGLYFTARAFHLDIKTRRADHLIEITKQHREIWTELYRRPELSRVRETTADLHREPITAEEELFIGLLILHLNASYHAIKERVCETEGPARRHSTIFLATAGKPCVGENEESPRRRFCPFR